jgi:4-amino-4-deoxy-L-arabinose transferase-like glycosyltransferase
MPLTLSDRRNHAQQLSPRQRRRGLLLILALGVLVCCWQLGATGLVDETPPLFAAAGRAMARTGDWLTPRVNGLPRYDKPPLVYWLMGLGYAIPGHSQWDPLGTWAARLPSALSTVAAMLMLGDTVMRHPQCGDGTPRRTALATALAFALSPLVLIWSRTAVSDALLCGTLALSLLCQWRCDRDGGRRWWIAWLLLGCAVLAKGPVAVVLTGLTLVLFGFVRRDVVGLWSHLRPLRGLALTALVSLPWYAAELLVEGEPFWNSFFGYHNLQRFTSVVNNHLQPWWFFGPVMLVAALPFTPLLMLGLLQVARGAGLWSAPGDRDESLQVFAACWLLAVLLLFTTAATKLPSYWLPATPAAALLISLSLLPSLLRSRQIQWWAWFACAGLSAVLAVGLWLSHLWIPLIRDPEMPTLPAELIASGLVLRAAVCFSVAAVLGVVLAWRRQSGEGPAKLLGMQGPLLLFQWVALVPMVALGDRVRQQPVRQVAAEIVRQGERAPTPSLQEPVAMVGVMKPSLHFYTNRVVVYEGRSKGALVNVAERLRSEQRRQWSGGPIELMPTALVVIDAATAARKHWQGLEPQLLGRYGIYRLWRLDRRRLEARADQLEADGVSSDWRAPRPERY